MRISIFKTPDRTVGLPPAGQPRWPRSSSTVPGVNIFLSVFTLLALAASVFAQGSRADYERAFNYRRFTDAKVLNRQVQAHWFTNSAGLWYQRELAGGGHEFIVVNTATGQRTLAFQHEKLATALALAGQEKLRADQLPLEQLELGVDGTTMAFRCRGLAWHYDLVRNELRASPKPARPSLPVKALGQLPRASRRTGSDTSIVFVNRTAAEVELFWLSTDGGRRSYGKIAPGKEHDQHTFAGHVWLVTNKLGESLAVFEAEENPLRAEIDGQRPMDTPARPETSETRQPLHGTSPDGRWRAFVKEFNVWIVDTKSGDETQLSHDGRAGDAYGDPLAWSPDSRKLVAVRVEPGQEHKVYLVESSPKDQLQPKLISYDYLKPGDKLPHPRPQLFDAAAKKQIPVHDELFSNPFTEKGDLNIRWERDSARFTFSYNQRGHQVFRVIGVNAADGAARAVVNEECPTFFDYSGKQYLHWLDDTQELVWMSERDGWNHLYFYDAATGRVKNQITRGDWAVRGVDKVDEQARQIWFRAGGIRPGQDPYHIHYGRVNFDGSGLTILTEGDGNHTIEFSPDRRFFLDTYSRVDLPAVHELRRSSDGTLVSELEQANWNDLRKTGWRPPERLVAKGRDGATDIFGVIHRPTNFDPARKYPIIEYIYAGPHDSFVPKRFSPLHGGWVQEMTELGFVVVQMDGMGTSNRSKKFHDVCWKNLGDAGFPDRIAWIKAAAAKYPQLDLARVGIYGGSAGGQNSARAMLAHGDFYKAAVSDCGCHDNRMDKIWWNEQWMGWPVGPHYDEQSNVTQAKHLRGKLMLVVGELDRNVDPATTLQLANALEMADKDYELLIVTGAGHGACETPYGKRRRADFFVRHLLGVEPRHD